MKFFSLTFLFLFSSSLLADRVEININGIRHSCTPIGSGGTETVECIEMAYRGPFSKEEAMSLCQGSFSTMPARCALRAYRGMFSKEEALNLCRRAISEGPLDCIELAYRGPFTREESIRLCSHRRSSSRTAECALNAYRGPYSKEEAISLCQERRQEENNVTLKMLNKSKMEVEELIKESNLKAFRLNEYK